MDKKKGVNLRNIIFMFKNDDAQPAGIAQTISKKSC